MKTFIENYDYPEFVPSGGWQEVYQEAVDRKIIEVWAGGGVGRTIYILPLWPREGIVK